VHETAAHCQAGARVVASRAVRTQRSARRRTLRIAALAGALAGAPAAAQPALDLNEMALRFTQGSWASPLVCEHGEAVRRGLRRLRIAPAPKDIVPPANHLVIYPMGIPEGVRCYLDTGETQVDVAGALTYHLEGFSRPDLAQKEFSETLQRDGAFTFEIKTGALEIGGKRTEFAGGKARFTLVRPGTDASKRLADIEAPHKLALSLTAPDGTNVAFDIALVAPGPKPSP
jgi:hypothetical protein